MGSNGERRPPRPSIEFVTEPASESEAAAVVAALERFLADTTPPSTRGSHPQSPWQHAALREGVSRSTELAWGPRSG